MKRIVYVLAVMAASAAIWIWYRRKTATGFPDGRRIARPRLRPFGREYDGWLT
jgi:hypothetical protein